MAAVVILKALAQRPNFYSAAVYLSQSSANLMILTNLVFVAACTVLLTLQKLLYGALRPIEVEQLYEKAWFAVTETCLAMTIFRGEIGPWFLIMFFALLAGKVWGWIGEGRVEILEQQPPRNPRLFHTRLALSLGLSILFDVTMLEYVVKQVMRMAKPDMMVMFGFEFAVLSLLSLSTAARYAINLVEIGIVREQKRRRGEEMRRERIDRAKKDLEQAQRGASGEREEDAEPTTMLSVEDAQEALRRAELPLDDNEVEVEGWEGKGRWIFYLDLTTDFFKLVLYLSFFFILLVFYGLPIHIMRDVFLTCRSFIKRISDFIKYRTATRDMNARYPDATAEEIGREDVCIICREEMRPYQAPAEGQQQAPNPVAERMRPKKLPCGHVLHFACLRSWLERQQVCPTCRRSVVQTQQGTNVNGQGARGDGAGAGQHPPGDRPLARVFQLGPLRIGVGAARGEHMFEELQQQMADNRAGAPRRPDQRNLQQYQFGIRWDGRRRARHAPAGTIREQLDAVERQLQEETQSLTQNSREYAVLRAAQLELERVRALRNSAHTPALAVPIAPVAGAQQLPLPPLGAIPFPQPLQSLQPLPGEQLLQAGSENLPAGMTLPEGWSMVPLRPTAAPMIPAMPVPPVPPPGFPMFPPPQQPTGPFPGHVLAPEHIQAMFSDMPGQPGNVQSQQQQQQQAPTQSQPSHQGPSQQPVSQQPPTQPALNPEQADPAVTAGFSRGVATSQDQPTVPIDGVRPHPTFNEAGVNGTREVNASTQSQPVPSWGSQPIALDENGGGAQTFQAATGSSNGTNGEPSTSSQSDEPRSKSARVEDAAEDLD